MARINIVGAHEIVHLVPVRPITGTFVRASESMLPVAALPMVAHVATGRPAADRLSAADPSPRPTRPAADRLTRADRRSRGRPADPQTRGRPAGRAPQTRHGLLDPAAPAAGLLRAPGSGCGRGSALPRADCRRGGLRLQVVITTSGHPRLCQDLKRPEVVIFPAGVADPSRRRSAQAGCGLATTDRGRADETLHSMLVCVP